MKVHESSMTDVCKYLYSSINITLGYLGKLLHPRVTVRGYWFTGGRLAQQK